MCLDFVQKIACQSLSLLRMVEHHHELECYARREKGCCQDHSENLCNQNIISAISSELMILLKLNLLWCLMVDSSWPRGRVFSKENGLLCLRSQWSAIFQLMFGQTIFSEPQNCFVTMVMHHHQPDYHAEKHVLFSSRSRSQTRLI